MCTARSTAEVGCCWAEARPPLVSTNGLNARVPAPLYTPPVERSRMTQETNVDVSAGELAQIVQSVFENMMNLPVQSSEPVWFPGSGRLTAAAHLTREWNGAVLLECTQSQACAFAARFLSMQRRD